MTDNSINKQMIENWRNLGAAALEAENYKEAYTYFSKVLENNEPYDVIALINKGKAAGLQTTYNNSKVDEFFSCLSQAIKIMINSNLSQDYKTNFTFIVNDAIYSFFKVLLPKMKKLQDQKEKNLEFIAEPLEIYYFWNLYLRGVGGLDEILNKYEGADDEPTLKYLLDFKKAKAEYLLWVCDFIRIKYPKASSGFAYVGIEEEQRKEFVEDYDKTVDEIRGFDPDFHRFVYIDRLDPPRSKQEALERPQVLKKIETERQQQKYWEEHPEEYNAHLLEEEKKKQKVLAEQKRKEKELAKQKRIEINEKLTLLDEQEKELNGIIDNLKIERTQLGLFAGKQKKELDAQVKKLTRANIKLQNEIKELHKQLKNIYLKLRD